jgi:hypothetical protein
MEGIMNEQEWLTCADPERMARYLATRASTTRRKLGLFACGCCRSIWRLLTDERSRRAVEVAEQLVDGRVPDADLSAVRHDAAASARAALGPVWEKAAQAADGALRVVWLGASPWAAALEAAKGAGLDALSGGWEQGVAWEAQQVAEEATALERRRQCDLLRDLFGNPFRPAPFDPTWLEHGCGLVGRIARGIYDERRFEDLPILHDALIEAGCVETEVLAHCRGNGPHVRGCWAVDGLLRVG